MIGTSTGPSEFGDLRQNTLRSWYFHLTRWILFGLLRLLTGYRVEGIRNVPRNGPLIVVANHLHNLDPLVVAVAIPRPVHYMAKAELFKVPVLGRIIRFGGTFPVERGRADRKSIRRAEETLRQGIAFGIFPEGTRSTTAAMTRPLAGAALIALRSGAPVLPVAVTGTEHLPFNGSKAPKRRFRRASRVTIGEPFTIPRVIDGERLTSEGATDLMMRKVAELLPAGYRGVYAGKVIGD
ncbi:MAG TPA: lysophospholipid acyltransferase family protein [Thermomicrobiales bacterium]|jgi:1-acyl-sn-glycerol-3-phosphate acyltransferase|nr:lysophospholipid acyltransferase family protein [Thermomicrobiales bacterium]